MDEKIKIVMIDDEEDLCLMVKANLQDTGEFQVATLSDPRQAESFIAREKPDLLLLDNIMPGRKGSEIVAALKKDENTKGLPVVMISGKGEMVYNKKKDDFKWMPNSKLVQERGPLPDAKGAEALSNAYGVDDYVSKPFKTDLLIEVIREVLAKKKKLKRETPDVPEEPPV